MSIHGPLQTPCKHWLQAHAGQSARAGNRGQAGAAYAPFQAASPRAKIVAGGHDARDDVAIKISVVPLLCSLLRACARLNDVVRRAEARVEAEKKAGPATAFWLPSACDSRYP
jgi:hypothetical protein